MFRLGRPLLIAEALTVRSSSEARELLVIQVTDSRRGHVLFGLLTKSLQAG
jgi:hypothetical protein